MTRIVGGTARGRRLSVPARGTRPTSDRAREALFNSLAALVDLDGAHLLDLYAGSGAVGLEGLSRGAAAAVFVESDRGAGDVVRANLAALGLPGGRLDRRPVAAVLVAGPPPEAPFDVVFADPPYALDEDDLTAVLDALAVPGWLAPDAVVVVERSARSPQPRWPGAMEGTRHRRYGEGALWYGRPR